MGQYGHMEDVPFSKMSREVRDMHRWAALEGVRARARIRALEAGAVDLDAYRKAKNENLSSEQFKEQ